MIVLNAKTIEFGDGDVGTGSIIKKDGVGVVYFTDLEKKYEVGEKVENKKNNTEQMVVSLNFKKIESIDVVISALERVKKLMLKKKKEE